MLAINAPCTNYLPSNIPCFSMETRTCVVCKKELPLSEFNRYWPIGSETWVLNVYCKNCKKEYHRVRRFAYYKAYAKSYSQRPEVKARQSELNRSRYANDPVFREKQLAHHRKKKLENPHLYWAKRTLKRHSKNGCVIAFTPSELSSIAKKVNTCPICGRLMPWGTSLRNNNAPTIDRINNFDKMGLEDIMIICHKCNTTKQNRTFNEMYNWCQKFISFAEKRNGGMRK